MKIWLIILILVVLVVFIGNRTQPSLSMRMASFIIARHDATKTEAQLDQEYRGRPYPTPAPITRSLRKLADVEERRVLGYAVYTLTPKHDGSRWQIIYMHGGGYVSEIVKPHWDIIEKLIRSTGATVSVPLYPLAPEHDHQIGFEFFDALYKDVVSHVKPENLILCGDSSGGNAALVMALRARDQKQPLPGHIILFAPWVDITASNPEIELVQPSDIMLRAPETRVWGRWWAGKENPKNPYLSPLYADVSSLPPIQIYQGTNDIALPDARKLRDKIIAAGGNVQLYETMGGFHDFMAATFTPESKSVFRQIALNLGM